MQPDRTDGIVAVDETNQSPLLWKVWSVFVSADFAYLLSVYDGTVLVNTKGSDSSMITSAGSELGPVVEPPKKKIFFAHCSTYCAIMTVLCTIYG